MIQVTKRDGSKEPLDIEKLHKVVFHACDNITGVSPSEVEIKSQIQFYNGMTSKEIQETLIKASADLIDDENPNYQFVAARLLLFATRKQLYGRMHEFPSLKQHVERCVEKGVYDAEILNLYTEEEFDRIFESLDHIFAKYQNS